MIQLSQESIERIRDSINSVADTINEDIEKELNDPEKTQDDKQQKRKDNVLEKTKTVLSPQEKIRLSRISRIFIDEWFKSFDKIRVQQEKRKEAISQIQENFNAATKSINDNIGRLIYTTEEHYKQQLDNKKEVVEEKEIREDVNKLIYITENKDIDKQDNKTEEKDDKKTVITSAEKNRYAQISNIFIKQLLKSLDDVRKQQEKRKALAVTKQKEPSWVKKLLNKLSIKKDKSLKEKAKKKNGTWWSKLIKSLLLFGGIYLLFKDKIDKFLPLVVKHLLGPLLSGMLSLAGSVFSTIIKGFGSLLSSLWTWIKETLALDKVGEFIADLWNKCVSFFDKLWEGFKSGFLGFINGIIGLPGKIIDWIVGAFKNIFDPILEAIGEAWDWICNVVGTFWDGIVDFVGKIWDGIKSIVSNWLGMWKDVWNLITDIFSWDTIKSLFDNILDILTGIFTGSFGKVFDAIIALFDGTVGKIWGWFKNSTVGKLLGLSDNPDDTVTEKTVENEKITVDNKELAENTDEITLRDNILETIQEICDKINNFFSKNTNSFFDLSKQAIEKVTSGFDKLTQQIEKITLAVNYKIYKSDTYRDSYDQSDRSVRNITHDTKNIVGNNYSISYNTLDVPSLSRAISKLESNTQEEIKLLMSQNDTLTKMVASMDGLGNKLKWLNPENLKNQQVNNVATVIPQPTSSNKSMAYRANATKAAYANIATIFA